MWVGGQDTDPGNLNERVPYWLNGAVPLALLSGDATLTASVHQYVATILANQWADGWLGPPPDVDASDCCQLWPRYPLLMALAQYAEGFPDHARAVDVRALRPPPRCTAPPLTAHGAPLRSSAR